MLRSLVFRALTPCRLLPKSVHGVVAPFKPTVWHALRFSSRQARELYSASALENYDKSPMGDLPAEPNGSRPSVKSGFFRDPKRLRHRKSVEKRILTLQRKAHHKKLDKLKYGGVHAKAQLSRLPMPTFFHPRAPPKKIHSDEEIERAVKRRELRRLLPFKHGVANRKQWSVLSNSDKMPDDETIQQLQKYKALKTFVPYNPQ